MAGDINLNPGPTHFSDMNLSFDSQTSEDDISEDEFSPVDGSQRRHSSGIDILYLNARSIKSVRKKKRINKIRDYCAIQSKKLL